MSTLNCGMASLVSNLKRCCGPDHGLKTPVKKARTKAKFAKTEANEAELLLTCSEGFATQVGFVSPRNYLTTARKPDLKRACGSSCIEKKVHKKDTL